MSGTVISYPIPAYQNLPIQPQFYSPRAYVIANIFLAQQTIISTIMPNAFVVGQLIRLIVPAVCGSYQLNEITSYILVILSDTDFILELDTSQNVDPFVPFIPTTPNLTAYTYPQVLAIGDINSGVTNSGGQTNIGTFIPGSFINISPE